MLGWRFEVWSYPGVGTLTKLIADLPVVDFQGAFRTSDVGQFTLSLPATYDRLGTIITRDPITPANDKSCLIRCYRDRPDGTADLIAEVVPQSRSDAIAESGTVMIAASSVEVTLADGPILPYDLPVGTTAGSKFRSLFPDWIFGGPNVLQNPGFEEGVPRTGEFNLSLDAATGGTFTLTYNAQTTSALSPPSVYLVWVAGATGGTFTLSWNGQTTAGIAWNASAATVETAVELLTTVDNATVTGSGTVGSPWKIEINTPAVRSVLTGSGASLTPGGATLTINDAVTAAIVEAALEALSTIDDATVSGVGTPAAPFRIEINAPPGQFTLTSTSTSLTPSGSNADIGVNRLGAVKQPTGWTKSLLGPEFQIEHGPHALDSLRLTSGGGEPPDTGTYALYWKGDPGANFYPGVQQVVKVQEGQVYSNVAIRVRPLVSVDKWALVLRDADENLISPTSKVVSSFTSGSYSTFSMPGLFVIPAGQTELIYRFASANGGAGAAAVQVDNATLNLGLPAATIGDIALQLITDLQTNHAADGLAFLLHVDTSSFTASVDSDSVAWPATVSLTVRRGQPFLYFLFQIRELGYRWELVFDAGLSKWKLKIYRPGGIGTDRSADAYPAINIGGGVTAGPIVHGTVSGNLVLAEGDDGWWSRSENAASIAAIGKRAIYRPDGNIAEASVQSYASEQLAFLLQQGLAITLKGPDGAWPTPRVDYGLGDKIKLQLGAGIVPAGGHIVEAVNLMLSPRSADWEVSFSSEHFTPEAAIAEGTRRLLERQAILPPPEKAQAESRLRTGGSGKPAFTVRVAASNSRLESKKAADFVCDGVDDHVEWQAAVNVADASGGGKGLVLIAEGEYFMTIPDTGQAIDLATGVSLIGLGMYVCRIQVLNQTNPAGSLILMRSANVIEGITFNGVVVETFLLTSGGDNYLIRDCSMFSGMGNQIFIDGADRWYLEGCVLNGIVKVKNGRQWQIHHNQSLAQVLLQGDCEGWNIDHNFFENGLSECIKLELVSTSSPTYGTVDHNNFSGFATTGAWPMISIIGQAYGLGGARDGLVIINNNLLSNSNGDGIYVETAAAIIHHNQIDGMQRHGIHLNAASHSQVLDNVLNEIGLETSTTYDGVFLEGNCDRSRISGNIFRDDGTPITRYCINVSAAACDETRIWHNDGNAAFVTAFINNAGTNTRFTPSGGTTNPGDNISS